MTEVEKEMLDMLIHIADFISRKHDANVGINWEVIDIFIDMYFEE